MPVPKLLDRWMPDASVHYHPASKGWNGILASRERETYRWINRRVAAQRFFRLATLRHFPVASESEPGLVAPLNARPLTAAVWEEAPLSH
jgi:hypothetical protein